MHRIAVIAVAALVSACPTPAVVVTRDAGNTMVLSDGGAPECLTPADCLSLGATSCLGGQWTCSGFACAERCPVCFDLDRDNYGQSDAGACLGPDCDDANPLIHDTDVQPCYPGDAGGAPDAGVCVAGARTCTAGVYGSCVGAVTPVAEVCNGLDDDCNGAQDDATLQQTCFPLDSGTPGIGVCTAGLQTCASGAYGSCVGAVTASAEACNGLDDDCNGAIDDGLPQVTCGLGPCQRTASTCVDGGFTACVPGAPFSNSDSTCNGMDDNCNGLVDENCARPSCVRVAPGGDDTLALQLDGGAGPDGGFMPFATIQKAIEFATPPGRLKAVCVANGPACNSTTSYLGPIVMVNGVSVSGAYESSTWTRCGTATVLVANAPEGVLFGPSVTSPTSFDGFRVDRTSPSAAGVSSAVTVVGATGAMLSYLLVNNAPGGVTSSYGVLVTDGGVVTISNSNIAAGAATSESIGVKAIGSRAIISDNCAGGSTGGGVCRGGCCSSCAGIKARPFALGGTVSAETYAVLLSDSPGSQVASTVLCGGAGNRSAGLKVTGDATGTIVRTNVVNGFGGVTESIGVSMEDCKGSSPLIISNWSISGSGTNHNTVVEGVRALGACHPLIDGNNLIVGGGEGQSASTVGVRCAANSAGTPSQCVVQRNTIVGSNQDFPPTSTGVKCERGSCLTVNRNLISGRAGASAYGVWLDSTNTLIENNDITGGCVQGGDSLGLYAIDANARVVNNRISAYRPAVDAGVNSCVLAGGSSRYFGARVAVTSASSEVELNSNVLDGLSPSGTCTSGGLLLDQGSSTPTGPRGVFRNNIFRAGQCSSKTAVREVNANTDPRLLENNDFDPAGSPSLYSDEGNSQVATIGAVNALAGAANNFSADPLFVNWPYDFHVSAASPCVDAGTSANAPPTDMDGQRRRVQPAVGVDEP